MRNEKCVRKEMAYKTLRFTCFDCLYEYEFLI